MLSYPPLLGHLPPLLPVWGALPTCLYLFTGLVLLTLLLLVGVLLTADCRADVRLERRAVRNSDSRSTLACLAPAVQKNEDSPKSP